MSSENIKEIRKALKKAFPEIKFSVRNEHYTTCAVSIMESPYFEDDMHTQHPRKLQEELYDKIDEVIRTTGGYYNNSDAMTDYFHHAFFYHIYVGKWDRPHKLTSQTVKGYATA